MSMGEILDVLVSKARLEAEDAQRVLLGALNGLAALMLLENGAAQTAMAIKTYRKVQSVCLTAVHLSVPLASCLCISQGASCMPIEASNAGVAPRSARHAVRLVYASPQPWSH